MAWVLHREATQEDWDRYIRTCREFVLRYGAYAGMRDPGHWLRDIEDTPHEVPHIARYVVDNSPWEDRSRLRAILRKRIRRALRHPWAEGIAYGHVGWYTD